jgi:hypothetical protein
MGRAGLHGLHVRGVAVAVGVVVFALVSVIAVRELRDPPATMTECDGVLLEPGDDVQAMLDAEPVGATLCFAAGTFRLDAPLTPKDGQRLMARQGATLNGARVVSDWEGDGASWRATGDLPAEPILHGECLGGMDCRHAEAVFADGRPLQRAMSRDDLTAGRFWADYESNEIWIADDPHGRTIEVARTDAALTGNVKAVLVDGFIVEKFANSAQRGAIHAQGDWTIQHNEVRLNHGAGVHTDGGEVLRNHIHHNGQLGLLGTGNGQLVQGNEIDHNNTAGFSFLWEAGGTKFAVTDGLVVRNNRVHHNLGPGLWTDINNINTLYERNVVHDNTSHGIFHEISYDAVIRDNLITDNGGGEPLAGWGDAGIRIAASPDVEVYGNVLAGNENAIMLIQQVREDWPSPHGPHVLRDIDVHDNDITTSHGGLTGQVDDTGSDASYSRNIRFRDNIYRLPSLDAEIFTWRGREWNRHEWSKQFDHDTAATFRTS